MHRHISHQHHSPKQQGGATLIGMAIVSAALIFIAIIAMKMFPAYTEYFSVKTVIHALNKEPLNTMSKKEIMDSFERRRTTSYVDVVTAKDLTIEKNSAGDTVVSVQYQVLKPLVANVSVLLDFAASSDNK